MQVTSIIEAVDCLEESESIVFFVVTRATDGRRLPLPALRYQETGDRTTILLLLAR